MYPIIITTTCIRVPHVVYINKTKQSSSPNDPISRKKTDIRKTLRVKLQKALKYCDYKKDDKLSDACNILWEEIESISEDLRKLNEEEED